MDPRRKDARKKFLPALIVLNADIYHASQSGAPSKFLYVKCDKIDQ